MDQWPSGTQFEIVHGEQHAVIVEVGGGIRAYDVGGVDVLQPYAVDQMCDGAHGAPLIPWPNRLGDGRYSFDGNDYQVALTEPEKQNAIHGFLRWRPWSCQENREDRLVMTTTLFPLEGYPFTLDVQVSYRLDETGLSVTTTATNLGDQPAPYACGQHPYLSAGVGRVDEVTLQFQANTRILTDPQRQLPTGREAVAGTAYDFRDAKKIGYLAIDDAFTDLAPRRPGPGLGAPDARRWPGDPAMGRPGIPGRRDLHRRHPHARAATARAGHRGHDQPTQRVPEWRRADPARTGRNLQRELGRGHDRTGLNHSEGEEMSRVVVVTGASGGIGRATVAEFARRGDRIALIARGQTGLDASRR